MYQGVKVLSAENVKTGLILTLADGRRLFVSF